MSRASKMNGYIGNFASSFLSCEKDTEEIVKSLFETSQPYSTELKKLLVINTPDCLNPACYEKTHPQFNQVYYDKIKNTSTAELIEKGYVRLKPMISLDENEEAKAYIVISYDNFTPNSSNPYYRDCTVMIDVICNIDYWDVQDYRLRPFKIAGYVDGILNGSRLSGIGTLQFMGCNEIILSDSLSGYCLMYSATHGVDDAIPEVEDDE